MKIQFNTAKYTLLNDVNVMPERFHAMFYKDENSFEDIINDTFDIEEVKIYNDEDELVQTYTGFTSRIALYVSEDNAYVSLEVGMVSSVDQRLDDLEDTVDILAETILGE